MAGHGLGHGGHGIAQSTQGVQGDGHGVASAGEASIQASKRAAAQKKLRDVICNKIFFTFFSMYCK